MNPALNAKLEGLRLHLEAAGGDKSYVEFQADADVEFLSEVAKRLKKAMGTKVDPKVKRGGSGAVRLELEGVDTSDMEVSLTVTVWPTGDNNAKVAIWGNRVSRGEVDVQSEFKVGVLTPGLVLKLVMEQLK